MLNPFLKLPTNRAANPCVHSTGYVPVAEITRVSPVVLQRYHPGVGYGISLLTAAGEPLAAFQHRRVREVPPSGVMGALRVSTALDPTLYEWACQLLRAMEWTGGRQSRPGGVIWMSLRHAEGGRMTVRT